jgi:hypothetical protein
LGRIVKSALARRRAVGGRVVGRLAGACALPRRRARIHALDGQMPLPGRVVETLVWTRGRNMPLAGLADRMMCPRCGARRVNLIFEPPPVAGRAG